MENQIFTILTESFKRHKTFAELKAIREASEKAVADFKAFTLWKDSPKSPFNQCFDGVDKIKDRVCYEKNNKRYSLEEVYQYWQNNVVNKEKI